MSSECEQAVKELHSDITAATSGGESWEQALVPHVLAAAPGCRLVKDARVMHEMVWADVGECWDVMTHAGPWHARRLARGDAEVDALRNAWLRHVDVPGHTDARTGKLTHRPAARMLVFERMSVLDGDMMATAARL
jgi:hypothetical protein